MISNKIRAKISKCVKRGAKLLDKHYIYTKSSDCIISWEHLIDIEALDMSIFEQCIIGQLYNNDYVLKGSTRVLEISENTSNSVHAYGFHYWCKVNNCWTSCSYELAALREAWVVEIESRLNSPSVASDAI